MVILALLQWERRQGQRLILLHLHLSVKCLCIADTLHPFFMTLTLQWKCGISAMSKEENVSKAVLLKIEMTNTHCKDLILFLHFSKVEPWHTILTFWWLIQWTKYKKLMHYISSNPLALVLYRKDCFIFVFVFKLLCLEFILALQVNPVTLTWQYWWFLN